MSASATSSTAHAPNPHQGQPPEEEEEAMIPFSTALPIPVDPIFPFFSLDELDVLCRVSKAFEKSLLPLSTTLVIDMHERAMRILFSYFSDDEEYLERMVNKYFPQQVVSAQGKTLPRKLYTLLIKETSPRVFNPLVNQIEEACAHWSPESAKLKASVIKKDIFYEVYRALHKKGITIAHEWALKARLLKEESIDKWTIQKICSDLVNKESTREVGDAWLPVAQIIAAKIPDATIRNSCQTAIVDAYPKAREFEKVENLLASSAANASSSALTSSTTSSTTPPQKIGSTSSSLPASRLPIVPSKDNVSISTVEPSITPIIAPSQKSTPISSPEPSILPIMPVAATESSAASNTSNPSQPPTQPVLPLVSNTDKPRSMQTTSLLSSYWNSSMLFRVFSILSLGLLPLAIFLWEACCMSTNRQALNSTTSS